MAKKKAKAKASGLQREVHDAWGWVVFGIGVLVIFSIAGWYYVAAM
jgi:hypothetical protein